MTVPEQAATRAERLRLAIAAKRGGDGAALPRRPAGEAAHLGELQRGLWFVHQLDPLSPAYNLYRAFRVDGRLDESRLIDALQTAVTRHRILRSTFRAEGDAVLQVVHEHMPAAVTRIMAERGAGTLALAGAAAQPFDLSRGPLVRLCIVEEQPGGALFLALALHHILADEPALDLLWREIASVYERGADSGADAAAQYDDYVYWSRQRDRAAHDADREYWRHRLEPLPEELRLPFERQPPAGDREERRSGRLIQGLSSSDVGPDIHHLAAIVGVSPFVVCAFAFRVLLHRYTEGQPIAFGTPVTARTPATADMIGYFLNAVVIYAAVDEQRSVRDALASFGREAVQSLAHATASFDEIAATSAAPRHADRHPLFQAMFVYQEGSPAPTLAGVRLEPLTLDAGGSKFDLTLFVTDVPGSLQAAVEYRTDRFDEPSMRSLLARFQLLVAELARDPGRRVADVPWIGSEEEARLAEWERGPALDVADPELVPRQILEQVEKSGNRLAVVCGGERQDYARFGKLAGAIARQLTAAGVSPGDRAAVFLDRSAAMVAALVGAHLAGAAYVPLDPTYPIDRNHYLLQDAAVAAVITTRQLRDRLPPGTWQTIDVDALADDPGSPGVTPALSAALPAYILYTSGSTGRPKGVVITHDNLRRSTQARLQVYAEPPGRFLLLSSVAFDSSVAGIFWTLATGGTLVIPTDEEVRDARALARLIDEARVTTLLCIPSLYAQLLGSGGEDLRRLARVIVAGERCPPELVAAHFRMLPHVGLFNEYGPTEATVWATVHAVVPSDAAGAVSVGRPIPGVRVEILDGMNRRVPAGVPGEAWIAGPTVASGYWQQAGLTAQRFVTDDRAPAAGSRRYRTGDRMAWTDAGRLLFLGRDDEQLKLRGYRVEPGEIEAALLEHPAVAEAAVVATADDVHAHLVAFVVAKAGRTIDDWRAHLAARLPDHMIPGRLEALPDLPRLPNGKIDRRQLAARPLPAPPSSADDDRPTAMEGRLIALWEELLRRAGVRASDNFFELGGHSLLVMQMLAAIERDCGVTLPAATVFQHPTVRELARRVEAQGGGAADAGAQLFPIQTTGRRTPLIMAVPDFFIEALAARFRGERQVFGVRGVSLRAEGNRGRWPTLTHLAEEVVGELRRRLPSGPYYIAGYSFGAWIAVEVARVLERLGTPARRLFVIAPMPVDFFRAGPLRFRVDGLRGPVSELDAGAALRQHLRSLHPFSRAPYRRGRQWLIERPWRRLLGVAGAIRRRAGLPLTPALMQADARVERYRLHAAYRPAPLRTPTTFFNPIGPATDSAATWRPYFIGPLDVHPIPDPHDDASVSAARDAVMAHLRDLDD